MRPHCLIQIAFLLTLLQAVGCSSATLRFESNPSKAKVYGTRLGADKAVLLGETPLVLGSSDLNKTLPGNGPASLEFRKDGYNSSRTVVTDLSAMDLTISMELLASSGLEDQERLNGVVSQVFEAQRLARAGKYDEALTRLQAIQKDTPQLAAAYELEGAILYLKKDYTKALDSYRTVIKLNPKDAEAVRMRNILEGYVKPQDARAPAGSQAKP